MSRKPRFDLVGVPQHVIQRGHNREPCFYAEDDYRRYRRDLQEAAEKNHARIHSYVLMTNHVHLLVTPEKAYSVTHMMQDLGRKFVSYMNRRYRRTGTLWDGRFKASLIETEPYLLTCMRYIEMNPVRAGMVVHPGEYRWSSYRANGTGETDGLVTPHAVYLSLGATAERRHHVYRGLFSGNLDEGELHAVRDALNQELVLGREDFKDTIEAMLSRQARPGKPGRPRKEGRAPSGS
ncbi:MAG TPA: transposase [Gammaproteobacteria bacterium]|nr:transposase [Gammaproteobacteria bacterium]